MHPDPTKMGYELLYTLVHDLRTPLQTLLTWAHVLRQGGLSEADTRQALEVLERNATLQRDTLDRFMEMGAVLDGSLVLEVSGDCDLRVLLQNAVAEVASESAKACAIRVSVPEDSVPIRCDGTRLGGAIATLIRTTVERCGAANPVAVALERNGAEALLYIGSDAGARMPPTPASDRQALMLAVACRVIELHSGHVQGADDAQAPAPPVTVRFAAAAESGRNAQTPLGAGAFDAASGATGSDARSKRVLVLDDEPDLRDMLSRLLFDDGFEVRSADCIANALRVTEEFHPHLMIVDWLLANGESGAEALRVIRALRPSIGAIVVSGLPPAQVRKEIPGIEVVDVLEKPFPMRLLVDRVRGATL